MKTHTHMRRCIGRAALAATAFGLSLAAQAQTSGTKIEAMVAAALPAAVGDEAAIVKLLSATGAEKPFSSVVTMTTLASVLGDSFASEPNCAPAGSDKSETETLADQVAERCVYEGKGSYLRYEINDGKFSYLNPTRAYFGTANTLAQADAQKKIINVAAKIGIPSVEIRSARIKTLDRMLMSSKDGKDKKIIRAEVTTRIPRQVGEVPVLGSRMSATIDAKGRIATMYASWPDFVMTPTAKEAPVVSRDAMTKAVSRLIAVTHGDGGKLAKVTATVVYADLGQLTNSAEQGSEADDGTGDEQPQQPSRYVPAILVRVSAVEPPEDGKTIGLPLLEFVQPLVNLSAPENG